MQIVVNGESQTLAGGGTVADLVEALGVSGRFAVELNEEIVPRSQYACVNLKSGDRLEIVQAIGGG